jgi:hypothetical protein
MTFARCLAAVAAGILCLPAGGALAAPKCDIVGTWADTYGTTIIFTSEKKGSLTNTTYLCPKSYAVKVSKVTKAVLDFTASTKDKSCTGFSVGGDFQDGGCTSVKGSITITGVGTLSDTITKQSTATGRRTPVDASALSAGLK